MHRKKRLLSLRRETIRQLTEIEQAWIQGGIQIQTTNCPTTTCPTLGCPTYRHSCFDSCNNTDCCLEQP
jgi:hypothetical protein